MSNLPHPRIVEFLQTVPLFQGVAEEDLARLAPSCRFRRYDKGMELFREGDEGNQMFLIVSGHVLIQRINEQGQVMFIAERDAGDYIGELALIDGQSRSADAVTSERAEFLILDRQAFHDWVTSHPNALWSLLQTLTARLRETMEALANAVFYDALGRLCSVLLKLAAKGTKRADETVLLQRITQERLAERIYSDRATVNRLLTSLETAHAIRREGRMLILTDLDRLQRLSKQ